MTNLEALAIPVGRRPEALADADLLALWRDGHEAGLEGLIRRHGGMVLGVCRRVLGTAADADDASQATFVVFLRKARGLSRPERLAAWLHAVALRTARRARADRSRRHLRETGIVDIAAPPPPPPEDARDLRRVIDEELERLPDKYRLPIVLCELEGRTIEEAARILGWPKGTVAGRLSRGRELLRERLTRRKLVLPFFFPGLLPAVVPEPTPEPLVAGVLAAADRPPRRLRPWLLAVLVFALLGTAAAGSWAAQRPAAGAGDAGAPPTKCKCRGPRT